MNQYSYIDNEFARNWIASRHESRRGVFTPLSYIDINEGNRFDADVFAQIMFWHEPNMETNQPRLTRQRDGHLWLVKNHAEWWAETRIAKRTVRACLERLQARNLIVYEVHGERGACAPWIRVNWAEFESRMKLWMDSGVVNLTEKDYQNGWLERVKKGKGADMACHTPLTRNVIPPDMACHTPLTSHVTPLTSDVISNTETTTETTSKTTQRGKPLAGAEAPPVPVSPVGELDWDHDPDIAAFFGDPVPAIPEPTVIPEPVPAVKAEPPQPKLPDYADRLLMQAAVRYYFNWQEPSHSSGWSHLNKMVGFFRGTLKGKDQWAMNQPTEDPLNALEVIGLRLWFRNQFEEDVTIPLKPETIANYIPQFRMAENYGACCKAAIDRLSKMVPAELMPAEPEKPRYPRSKLEEWGEVPGSTPLDPAMVMQPGEDFHAWKLRMYTQIAAGQGVDLNGRPLVRTEGVS